MIMVVNDQFPKELEEEFVDDYKQEVEKGKILMGASYEEMEMG